MIDATLDAGQPQPVCVMTRIRLRGPRSLLGFIWSYQRMRAGLGGVPGLMHVAFLAEGPLTFWIVSIWRNESLMQRWVGDPAHVDAIHHSYQRASETWSGRWRLEEVSSSARRWSASPAMEGEGIRTRSELS